MIEPLTPKNEYERQKAVESYSILDTLPEESYDNITEIVSYITKAPISLITLLDNDRNYIKSNCGFPISESPRNISFCGHAINQKEKIMVVEDAREDERFINNPLVEEHKAIFYAGVPLINPQGYKLGTLCVYDHEPRQLNKTQKKALISMSKHVVNLFEQRLQNKALEDIKKRLEKRNQELNKFASIVSHDLKSPITNIIALTELLEDENKGKLNDESKTYLNYLKSSSTALKDYIDGLLIYYKNDDLLELNKETTTFNDLITKATKIAIPERDVILKSTQSDKEIIVNKSVILQIFVNLLTNAVKYGDKNPTEIFVEFSESEKYYNFSVKDNGKGMPNNQLTSIFDLFTTLKVKDKHGNLGTGIGLASVKKLVEHQGGSISVNSTEGLGSIFSFTIEK
ncbi:GAF domain-containing protein [Lacinutrix venerupis]|uniref:GAF domain-containing sensor histidine kinase n=1 Tax=Lacinutrix venerupis TaxID=1486034 RepID=UPI000EAC91BD|nr:GAF domain-containing sensor histidine kinase [Lacinutrix venerupis]RLJ62635.1 GAF domain-containing protein [Lacinutrix venerupis]